MVMWVVEWGLEGEGVMIREKDRKKKQEKWNLLDIDNIHLF